MWGSHITPRINWPRAHAFIWPHDLCVTCLPRAHAVARYEPKVCLHAFVWSDRSAVVCPSDSLIVSPRKHCGPITWGDSFTMCSLGESPGPAIGRLGFQFCSAVTPGKSLTHSMPISSWTNRDRQGGKTTWTSKILSSCNVGGTKSFRLSLQPSCVLIPVGLV